MQAITYELKYCERCGSLGLRRCQSDEMYCAPCGQILINYSFPTGVSRPSLPRKAKPTKDDSLRLEGHAQSGLRFGRLQ
jgi:hypothetical protein